MLAVLVLIACLGLYACIFKMFEIKDRAKAKHKNELMMKQWEKKNKHD